MATRFAAIASLIVFAVCLLAGAANTFGTAVERALEAMGVTLILGMAVGWMAQQMLEENIREQTEPPESKTEAAAQKPARTTDNPGAKTAGRKDGEKSGRRGR
jgi:ABC-type nickel/cobalt efflux system permease component RcnA